MGLLSFQGLFFLKASTASSRSLLWGPSGLRERPLSPFTVVHVLLYAISRKNFHEPMPFIDSGARKQSETVSRNLLSVENSAKISWDSLFYLIMVYFCYFKYVNELIDVHWDLLSVAAFADPAPLILGHFFNGSREVLGRADVNMYLFGNFTRTSSPCNQYTGSSEVESFKTIPERSCCTCPSAQENNTIFFVRSYNRQRIVWWAPPLLVLLPYIGTKI